MNFFVSPVNLPDYVLVDLNLSKRCQINPSDDFLCAQSKNNRKEEKIKGIILLASSIEHYIILHLVTDTI